MIALDPMATSVFCMHLQEQKGTEYSTYDVFKSGEKYMIVDVGGISFLINIIIIYLNL